MGNETSVLKEQLGTCIRNDFAIRVGGWVLEIPDNSGSGDVNAYT